MSAPAQADVVILGAGVAGCTAALALAASHRVLVLDKQANPAVRPGDCLPAAAGRVLRQLGLWQVFQKQGHLPSLGMESHWGSCRPLVQDSLRNPEGNAWHLNRPVFEQMLRQAVQTQGGIIQAPDTIAAAQRTEPEWLLTLESGRRWRTSWVIDASGGRASFVRKLGIGRQSLDSVVAAWMVYDDADRTGPAAHMARISAAANGWWYSAPLPHGLRLMAFHTDKDLIDTRQWRQPQTFMAAAQATPPMAQLLPRAAASGSFHYRGITAANSSRLTQAAGSGWAAIGDAAISFDPLSSQGMYNAMVTAMQFAELLKHSDGNETAVAEAYNQQADDVWRHYLRHRSVFYGEERRWLTEPFWERRVGLVPS